MNNICTLLGGNGPKYTLVSNQKSRPELEAQLWRRKHSALFIVLVALVGLTIVVVSRYYVPHAKPWEGTNLITSQLLRLLQSR